MRTTKRGTHLVVCLLSILVVVGCGDVVINGPDWAWDGDFPDGQDVREKAEASFSSTHAAATALSLTGVAGSVEIVGSSTSTSIDVEGTRRVFSEGIADAQRHLPHLRVEVREVGGTVFIETQQPQQGLGRRYEVDYRISVPRGVDVTVQHVGGAVGVRSIQGDVDINSVAGAVTLHQLFGNVRAMVATGEIEASLTVPLNGSVDLANTAGHISLTIPKETSAALRAATLSGVVRLLNLDLHDRDPRRSVVLGTLAGGKGEIHLESLAGDITVNGT